MQFGTWTKVDAPMTFVAGRNHATILSDPEPIALDLVDRALQVSTLQEFDAWIDLSTTVTAQARSAVEHQQYQQFIVRALDERQDPITDYHVEVFTRQGGEEVLLEGFDLDPHTYAADKSLRCFHVNLGDVFSREQPLESLWLRVIASSGTALIGYDGYNTDNKHGRFNKGITEVEIDITDQLGGGETEFFHPYTTTFVEILMNREPQPLGVEEPDILRFLPRQ